MKTTVLPIGVLEMAVGPRSTNAERATGKAVTIDHRSGVDVRIPIVAGHVLWKFAKSRDTTFRLPKVFGVKIVPRPGLFRPEFRSCQRGIGVAASTRRAERFT